MPRSPTQFAILAEAGDRAVDEFGIDLPQGLESEAQPVHRARPEAFYQDVGLGGQSQHDLVAIPLPQIKRQPFVAACILDICLVEQGLTSRHLWVTGRNAVPAVPRRWTAVTELSFAIDMIAGDVGRRSTPGTLLRLAAMSAHGLFLRDVDLGNGRPVAVQLRADRVIDAGPDLSPDGDPVVDCGGAALLPGLHDHHLHLLATAAAAESVDCGPPTVITRADLTVALCRAQPRDGWIRGIGYDDGLLGLLDRTKLDAARADTPVRVQHRSGALWVVNSAGAKAMNLDATTVNGVERDAAGRATGRLWRLDNWLRSRFGAPSMPDLAGLSQKLAAYGITGVTDATPDLDLDTARRLRDAPIAQRLQLLGASDWAHVPAKIVITDHDLPTFGELAERFRRVRPRPVALHCVTRASLVLALSVVTKSGVEPGDRIEHAAVCPPEIACRLAALGIPVITQPSMIAPRRRVPPAGGAGRPRRAMALRLVAAGWGRSRVLERCAVRGPRPVGHDRCGNDAGSTVRQERRAG